MSKSFNNRPEPTSSTPEGILVRLKTKLQKTLGLEPQDLKKAVDHYVTKMFHGSTSSKTHFAKVNTYNELSKDRMTIKVFFKYLRILNVKKVQIKITVLTQRDREYTVIDEVNLFSDVIAED